MAKRDVVTLNETRPGAEVPQAADTARLPRPLELSAGPAGSELEEFGTDGFATSDIRNFTVNSSLTVQGLQPFTTHRAMYVNGTINVLDNNGILHHGKDYETNVEVRIADPAYCDVIGDRVVVQRNTKGGVDIGAANVFLTGHLSFCQQDSGTTARTLQMTAARKFLKIEDGIVDEAFNLDLQSQIGTSAGRTPTVTKLHVIGMSAYQIGRAAQTLNVGEFVQLDLPAPIIAGTVNFTSRHAINQRDPLSAVRFTGEVTMENVAVFLPNIPTTQPAGSRQLWDDNGTIKITP